MRQSALVLFCAAAAVAGVTAQKGPAIDAAMRAFWSADTSDGRAAAVAPLMATGAGYDELAARLHAGREYRASKTGRINLLTSDRGVALDNVLEVPAEYDPSRSWPLRVSLHGGVGRPAPGPNDPPARPLTNRTQSAGELVLHPRAFAE